MHQSGDALEKLTITFGKHQTKKRTKAWRLWCLALGEKASKHNHEADAVALIRSLIFISYFVTNLFIVSGVIRHWDKCPGPEEKNVSIRIDRSFWSTRRLWNASTVV
jgi:hypothetical protein